MPAGKLLGYEPCGLLRIIGSQGAVVLLESDAPGGRSAIGVLSFSGWKVMKRPGPPFGGGAAGIPECALEPTSPFTPASLTNTTPAFCARPIHEVGLRGRSTGLGCEPFVMGA